MKTATIVLILGSMTLMASPIYSQGKGLRVGVRGARQVGTTWLVEAGGVLELEVDIPAPGGNLLIGVSSGAGVSVVTTVAVAPGSFSHRFALPREAAGQHIFLDVYMLGLDGGVYRSAGLDLLLVETLPLSMPIPTRPASGAPTVVLTRPAGAIRVA